MILANYQNKEIIVDYRMFHGESFAPSTELSWKSGTSSLSVYISLISSPCPSTPTNDCDLSTRDYILKKYNWTLLDWTGLNYNICTNFKVYCCMVQ